MIHPGDAAHHFPMPAYAKRSRSAKARERIVMRCATRASSLARDSTRPFYNRWLLGNHRQIDRISARRSAQLHPRIGRRTPPQRPAIHPHDEATLRRIPLPERVARERLGIEELPVRNIGDREMRRIELCRAPRARTGLDPIGMRPDPDSEKRQFESVSPAVTPSKVSGKIPPLGSIRIVREMIAWEDEAIRGARDPPRLRAERRTELHRKKREDRRCRAEDASDPIQRGVPPTYECRRRVSPGRALRRARLRAPKKSTAAPAPTARPIRSTIRSSVD